MDYNLTFFSERQIQVQLNFTKPLLISQGDQRDEVVVKMKEDFFLTSKNWKSISFKKKKPSRRRRNLKKEKPEDEDIEKGYRVLRTFLPPLAGSETAAK